METTESDERASQALRRHGLRPRRSLGQNFLKDRSYLSKILDAAELATEDEVVEIGAGTGVLTAALAKSAGRVVAIELDDSLVPLLSKDFAAIPNVEVWHGSALDFDPGAHFSGSYKALGNIPYYVTGPIVRHFLEVERQPEVLVLMVQREVAERIVAPPGKLSLLGVSVQFYAHPKIVASVPAGAFYPRPKVDSAILRLTPYRSGTSNDVRYNFFRVVRAGFSAPRKQLINSLGSGLGLAGDEARSLLLESGIEATRRAETLSIDEWERLAEDWRARKRND
jgi:16S rRNA (adenine1518-N6/adenine1519-N6)-dimethyltransferase